MRILILGAGAVGGYFGGRLAQAGADVTFLVRERRARQLRETGLIIESAFGDVAMPVTVATEDEIRPAFDLVLVSCKAYDLETALLSVGAGLAPGGRVLPLLNGLAHFDRLDAAFGAERVLGGMCHISVTLGPRGEIQHLNRLHRITFGERFGSPGPCAGDLDALKVLFKTGGVDAHHSAEIMQRIWEKFVLIASLAAITCVMRAPVGIILKTEGGRDIVLEVLEACRRVAEAAGFPPLVSEHALAIEAHTQSGSALKASMLRDLERGGPTEAEQIVGDMARRAKRYGIDCAPLQVAYAHLQAYEMQRVIP